MKKSELRKIIKEELQAVLREKEEEVELSSDEQKIFDDIIGEETNVSRILTDIADRNCDHSGYETITCVVIAKDEE